MNKVTLRQLELEKFEKNSIEDENKEFEKHLFTFEEEIKDNILDEKVYKNEESKDEKESESQDFDSRSQ